MEYPNIILYFLKAFNFTQDVHLCQFISFLKNEIFRSILHFNSSLKSGNINLKIRTKYINA